MAFKELFMTLLIGIAIFYVGMAVLDPYSDIEFTPHNATITDKHTETVFLRTDYYFVVEESENKTLIDVRKDEYYTYNIGDWYNYTSPRYILN
jgi:hypothetical protein